MTPKALKIITDVINPYGLGYVVEFDQYGEVALQEVIEWCKDNLFSFAGHVGAGYIAFNSEDDAQLCFLRFG